MTTLAERLASTTTAARTHQYTQMNTFLAQKLLTVFDGITGLEAQLSSRAQSGHDSYDFSHSFDPRPFDLNGIDHAFIASLVQKHVNAECGPGLRVSTSHYFYSSKEMEIKASIRW